LNFNHPCKELIWVTQPDANVQAAAPGGPQWFNYTDAVDLTYFTGTPSDPDGGGMAAPLASNPYNQQSLPLFSDASGATAPGATGPFPFGPNLNGLAGSIANAVQYGGPLGIAINPLFDSGVNPTYKAKLQLNGHDRFTEREGRYFNLVQPYQHHTNVPATGINVYSFGLKPEEHQPSGTCNFSRIDNATLSLNLTPATVAGIGGSAKIRVYATNYNVLRIMSGMGGMAYSN